MPRRTPGPYLPLDINFTGNPKIIGLSDGAFRLHISGMLYCKQHKTDGIIGPTVVPQLVPRFRPTQLHEIVDRMLWVTINGTGHYQIHDWLAWNLSIAEVQRIADQRRDAARRRWDQ